MTDRHREPINLDAWPVHVQAYIDEEYRKRGIEIVEATAFDRFANLTTAALAEAIDGFPLPLCPGRDLDWLAHALRKTVALATPIGIAVGDKAQPNSVTQANLTRAAAKIERAAAALKQLSDLDLVPVVRAMELTPRGAPLFRLMPAEFEYVADAFRNVARSLHIAQGPTRVAAARELAVRRAFYVAPLFETAFGVKATVNDYPGANPGPWPDFFGRIIFAATGDRVADLRKVLKEARSRHIARQGTPLAYSEKWLAA